MKIIHFSPIFGILFLLYLNYTKSNLSNHVITSNPFYLSALIKLTEVRFHKPVFHQIIC